MEGGTEVGEVGGGAIRVDSSGGISTTAAQPNDSQGGKISFVKGLSVAARFVLNFDDLIDLECVSLIFFYLE